MQETIKALSWEELSTFVCEEPDIVNGANNPYSLIRLFGKKPEELRITLFRDNHAWCPYCQKVWLWLESKEIPYQVKKVTMHCYGNKEHWYLKKVPSGMLPALELDKKVITESDQILLELESSFGNLGLPLEDPQILNLRRLERKIFRSWCIWLCNPSFNQIQELKRQSQFQSATQELDDHLSKTKNNWIDPSLPQWNGDRLASIDIIFIPYLERMNASLAYYKGFNLREKFPNINKWFNSLEALEVYRATQGDFHTHSHDLPPQMGGCWSNKSSTQKKYSQQIDIGTGLGLQETSFIEANQNTAQSIALSRVFKHKQRIMNVNPLEESLFEQSLRAALTKMITGKTCIPKKGTAIGLRYLKDRISVPRDMPLLSAREFRRALEETAKIDSETQGPPIPLKNRLDQNPVPFKS